MTITADSVYRLPTKPRVKIYTQDGSTLVHTWDGFAGSNPFILNYIDVDDAQGESGIFNLIIIDPDNSLNTRDFRNCEVHIEFGRSSSTYKYYLIGPGRIFDRRRPRTNYQEYLITGFGDWIKASEHLLLIRQSAKVTELDDSTPVFDPQFDVSEQVHDAIEAKKYRPLNREPIVDTTQWDTSGIERISVNNPIINEVFSTLWDFAERNAALSGAPVWMDFSEGTKKVTMRPLSENHTGVVIKTTDLGLLTDNPFTTSYIKEGFHIEDNNSTEAGSATRLYTSTIIDRSVVAKSTVLAGSTALDFKALAQQILIQNDARRLDSLEVKMSKVGEPESPNSRVNGDIVLDNGNNEPKGTVLDTFSVPLSSIETKPTTIEIPIDVSESKLEGGPRKLWVRFMQRSGLTGKPTHDPANTIRLHHNGIFNTVQSLYSAQAPEGDNNKKDTLAWSSTNQGPIFYFKLRSDIRRLHSRTNDTAKKNVGLIERYIDTSWIHDPRVVQRFLSVVLSQTSKARRIVPDLRVSLPREFLFRKYQGVTMLDGFTGEDADLQVMRARYVVSALPGDPQIGTWHADITLGGLYNSLLASCGCA